MKIYFVYVTTSDAEEAAAIAEMVVTERLAACANAIPGMQSTYWWDGAVQQDTECVLVLKTAVDRLDRLRERVAELHSYDLPCVVAMEIVSASVEYRAWIIHETRSKPAIEAGGG
jgi:periplasmic divalent cation tolerance protein